MEADHPVKRVLGMLIVLPLVAALSACGPGADVTPSQKSAPVLLVGGDVFSAGDRVASRLDAMARATGALGASEVRMLHVPGAGPAELAAAVAQQDSVRAVIAIVGDRHLLSDVDPAHPFPPDQKAVSSRRIDWDAFDEGLDDLRAAANSVGATLVLASPPLGLQGRVELPELLGVAPRVKARGPSINLTAMFRKLEPGPHFVNGLTVLDGFGHDALAALLLRELTHGQLAIPPGSGTEHRAREVHAALLDWAAGDDEALATADAAGALRASPDPRLSVAIAAAYTALHGPKGPARALWARIGEVDPPPPGLALGQLLLGKTHPTDDPLEAAVIEVLIGLATDAEASFGTARQLVLAEPQRVESWMVLQLSGMAVGYAKGIRKRGSSSLRLFDGRPISNTRRAQLLGDGLHAMRTLPALIVVSSIYADSRVDGPSLRAARRKHRVGMVGTGLKILDTAIAAGPVPPQWLAERERIAQRDQ